ncbi:MAG: 4-hydroxythreonine-4-phosphate dehydrogenase PdxA [Bdellovibrionota bacterium]
MNKRLVITLGDPFGIGPEIVVKAFAQMKDAFPPSVICGNKEDLEKACNALHVSPFWSEDVSSPDPIVLDNCYSFIDSSSKVQERGRAVLSMLDRAMEWIDSGDGLALVTCPIDKSVVRSVDPEFVGHTEYLALKNHKERSIMMMSNAHFNVVLLTGHVALKDVSSKITVESMVSIVHQTQQSLQQHFGIHNPRIAVLGLNPHAGEIQKHSEEKEIFAPAIQTLRDQGVLIEGSFSADSFFSHHRGNFDLVISPYHDQGLIAVKYEGLDTVINTTLGLDFVRCSPGHGVAYDIQGKGIANASSLIRALKVAQTGTLSSL